jgi:hypothetical protein
VFYPKCTTGKPYDIAGVPIGSLRLSKQTVEKINETHVSASEKRIVDYIKEALQGETNELNPQQLTKYVREAKIEGSKLGLQSEYAHGLFALLFFITDAEIVKDQNFTNIFHIEKTMTPDEIMDELFKNPARKSSKGVS